QRNGAKVVVIDPLRTKTAQLADWHLPIRPGTDGALALGLMHVIIRDGLVDTDYVTNYTVGYDDLAARALEFTPERVAGITGIAAEDVVKLAHEYAKSQPSAIRIGVGIERSAGGGQVVRAVTCLPALVGAWRKPGGGILQLPLWAFPVNWPGLHHAELMTPGTRVINQWELGKALAGDMVLDPPIGSLFVYNSNPVVVAPDQARLRRGLSRDDLFTVVSEHFITDTARYADILLPATTQVEQDDLMFSWGHLYLTLNKKAIEPIGEAVSNTELFRRLAKRMGFEEPLFYRSDAALMQESLDWSNPALAGITLESLQEKGYARLNFPAPDQFALHAEGNFPTPSGKVEMKASMAAGGNFVLPVFRQGSNDHQDGNPVDPVPNFIPPRESAATNSALGAKYPLSMLSPKSHAFLNSEYANLRRQLGQAGTQHVVIHPADAKARSIIDGALVRVENARGVFHARAKVSDEITRGVVVAPVGYWPSISEGDATPAALNPTVFADIGRAPTFSDNLVEVRAA
ncbi:MAG: molybdopterin-dependent oxidoreductase, partial [Burkholderiales bacterium]|nr:molybdopterin-dependent oxidoreductase [Burkholderiales bacterium]